MANTTGLARLRHALAGLRGWLRRHRRRLRWVWAGVLVALTLGSLVPASGVGLGLPGLDKLAHFAGYAVAGALAAVAWPDRRRLALAVLLVLALGGGIELAQIPVPMRGAGVLDMLANGLGVAAGVAAVQAARAVLAQRAAA